MLEMREMQKFSFMVNAILLGFVASMEGFYIHYGVTYMIYHSIPTIAAYLCLFFLLYKKWLDIYVWCVYVVITIYMVAATVCLGYSASFHLYCMSLIPLTFYMEYFAHKLHTRRTYAMPISMALVAVYLLSTGYVVIHGPIYAVDRKGIFLCLNINAISVFCFLIGYANMLHKLVIDSEIKLSDMAHKDQLTGLFNRHYMLERLEDPAMDLSRREWIAMVDIDSFKRINDTYGHACGDYVLVEMGRIMQDVCQGCVISRWGGEEFLITPDGQPRQIGILEQLRQAVERATFSWHGQEVAVTVTIGISEYQAGQSLDRWIQRADHRLYEGKNGGKNRVID